MRTGRAVGALVVAVLGLSVAFVAAPGWLAAATGSGRFADQPHLVRALRDAFAEYWGSGERRLSPSLQRVADYWLRYHLAKGVFAVLLLVAFVALGVVLWRAFLRPGGRARRAGLALGGGLATALALFSAAVVMANLQGAVAPYASLMPMLVDDTAGTSFAGTLAEVRAADGQVTGSTPPALPAMVDQFARYHVAMAVIAGVVTVAFVALGVLFWRRFARSRARERRVWAGFGVLAGLMTAVVLVVAVANATTAADPAPAFAGLLNGGW